MPSPSPSSIELQTLVEAKESEEPLCWDPWNDRQQLSESEILTDVLRQTSEKAKLVKLWLQLSYKKPSCSSLPALRMQIFIR